MSYTATMTIDNGVTTQELSAVGEDKKLAKKALEKDFHDNYRGDGWHMVERPRIDATPT